MNPLSLGIDLGAGPALGIPVALALDIDVTVIIWPVLPRFMLSAGVASNTVSRPLDDQRSAHWGDAQLNDLRLMIVTDSAGQHHNPANQAPWNASRIIDPAAAGVAWDAQQPRETAAALSHDRSWPKDRTTAPGWDDSIQPTDDADNLPHGVPKAKDQALAAPHADPLTFYRPPVPVLYLPKPLALALPVGQPLGLLFALDLDLDLTATDIQPDGPTYPISSTITAPWGDPAAQDRRHALPWDSSPRADGSTTVVIPIDPNPPPEPPDAPDIREDYLIVNNATIVTLPGRVPIDAQDVSIALDIDSLAWTLSARILNDASMDLIRPDATGPAEVEIACNGQVWVMIVDKYSTEAKFPARRYRISGVSRTQFLADPYAPKRTRRIAAPISIRGLITDELLYTGFDHTWDAGLPDYTIPADVWGYEGKTPLGVISELAGSVGAVIVPDQASDTLHIQHRYRAGQPWSWATLDPSSLDAIIIDNLVTGYSSQWTPRPLYNAVHVSGISAGVTVDVIRFGTAGDAPAADVLDALNVDVQQCRARGRAILGESGNQEVVSLELPLLPSGAPGLLLPGMLVEYQVVGDPAKSWRGLVLSVSVSIAQPGASRVVQSVQIERHHY